MPADLLRRLPPAPSAIGLLPVPRPVVPGKEEPADGGKDGQPATSRSLFEEWMRHWIAGRPDTPPPDGTAAKNGSRGIRP